MQVTREDLNPCTVKLSVVCDEAQVVEGFDKALKQLAKRIRVPGFRPGMAPKAIIEGMIQPEELNDAAAENIVRKAYKAAIDQEKLVPHTRPAVDLTTLDKDSSKCEFTIKVPLEPQVELGDYKGLTAKKPPTAVTEEELEHQIEEMRRRKSTREAVTGRGVQEGDVAVVNIRVDGEEGDGRTFMTVAGQTFPQLDQALMGMEAEQMKSLDLTFPENFQEKDWAGKPMHSQVTLRSLSAVKLPEVDDEFAQAFQVESVDELKNRLRENMAASKENMIREYVNEQLLEDLMGRSTIHVPDNMWESVADQRMRDIAQEQQERKLSLEEYAAQNGMTVEQLAEAQRNEAKMHVQRAVLVQRIAAAENLQNTNTELNIELALMAREFEMDAKQLLNILKKNDQLSELHFRATFRKVMQFLTENANIAEEAE